MLLDLIRKSQFSNCDFDSCYSFDFEALYAEAKIHAVLGVIADYIPDEYKNEKLMNAFLRQKAFYIQYCNAEYELKRILDSNDIPFVIIKGNAAAISYSIPSYRTMGDIDFIVHQDKYVVTQKVLLTNGYSETHNNGRHITYIKNGFIFELHHHFSGDIDIEEYVIEGIKERTYASIEGHEFPILPPLANGLVLLDHLRRHLRSGLGLRHVLDWMMYVYHYLDDNMWNNQFHIIVKEKGMETIAIVITRMCQLYLGLPNNFNWCKSADESLCKELLDCILVSGNFGSKNQNGYYVEKVSISIKRDGLFKWLQHAGEFNWKLYHKYHWLKPFCWFYQILRYAKQGIKTGRSAKQIKGDLDRSKERMELLKKLGIE